MLTRWRTISEKDVPDIEQFVAEASALGQEVHIGTDSLQSGRVTNFVTIVAVLNPPKGGRAVYAQKIVPRIKSLRERLMHEVWLSVELGLRLSPKINGDLTIHIDANPDQKFMSSRYLQELVGLVVSQGFRALWKPDSWAATHCADHVVRIKGKVPKSDAVQRSRKTA